VYKFSNNISFQERVNKANLQTLSTTFSTVLHISHRLFSALVYHNYSLFPNVILEQYQPPLTSSAKLPDDPPLIKIELRKLESLLLQIHLEADTGVLTKHREELMWEVQRIITQLKVILYMYFLNYKFY